jgi:hypothetical protein
VEASKGKLLLNNTVEPGRKPLCEQLSAERSLNMADTMKHPLWRAIIVPLFMLIVVLLAWWAVVSSETPAPEQTPPPPALEVEGEARETFYRNEVKPLVQESRQANRRAADRAIMRINEVFARYRAGIEPFTEDITSFGTRFGVLWRMPGDWWYEDQQVKAYVEEKFKKHLFSKGQFNRDMTSVLEDLKADLQANENRLLSQYKAALASSDLPEINVPNYQNYEDEIHAIISKFSSERGRDSVYQGIAGLVVGEVVTQVTYRIITRVLVKVGTSAASSAATAGGATATAGATGAGTGSFAGPVGTVIGAGVGIAVGILIDWWMTEQFEQRLAQDLNGYFDQLESKLLEGTDKRQGLKATLNQFVEDLNEAQATVVRRPLTGAQ